MRKTKPIGAGKIGKLEYLNEVYKLNFFKKGTAQDVLRKINLLYGTLGNSYTLATVSKQLLRYTREGLLKRERKGRAFFYSLTSKGLNRRDYLEKKENARAREIEEAKLGFLAKLKSNINRGMLTNSQAIALYQLFFTEKSYRK